MNVSALLSAPFNKFSCKLFFVVAACCFFTNGHANLEGNYWVFHYGKTQVLFNRVESSLRGSPMVLLDNLTQKFKLKATYNPETFEIRISNPTNKASIHFYTFSKTIYGDDWSIDLSRKIEFEKARPIVPVDFGDRALRPLLNDVPPTQARLSKLPSQADIVIDPGHGGNDYGASYEKNNVPVREKDITLQIARELADALKKQGVSVALTRETDSFLTLPERTRLANQLKAKLFLSIHLNSDPNPKSKANGYEIYVLSLQADEAQGRAVVALENQMIPEDLSEGVERTLSDLRAEANLESSLNYAKAIHAVLGKQLKPSTKPIQMGPFYVLYGGDMPALLLEIGYISSSPDRVALTDEKKRQTWISSLSSSLAESFKKGINKP